jgi:hypothetical protein
MRKERPGLRNALAGIHAGVLGALAIIACLMIGSVWDHRSVWSFPNLLATTFFGSDAYVNKFAHTTWTGLALIVATYGFLGMLWGVVCGDKRRSGLALFGAITGILVYFVLYNFVWKHVNPLVTLYGPNRQLQVGHLLWGLILARSPKYSRAIGASVEYRPPEEPAVQEAVPAVSSGEVIR